MSQDEDRDLERAIALSLQDAPAPHNGDDDDEEKRFQRELALVLEASKQDAIPQSSHQLTDRPSSAASFLSERAQLEKERRERQKRRRNEAGLNEESGDDSDIETPAKRQQLSSSSKACVDTKTSSATNSAPSSLIQAPDTALIDQLFWDGELRQVANMHAGPSDTRPKFTLTDTLGPKSELAFAIMSSYVTSIPWISSFFDPEVPVIIVGQPDQTGNESVKSILPNWIRVTPFLRNGFGVMHMKFMLLFYKTGRLRIMISTANLIDYDYRDIENSLWLQDIPQRPAPRPHDRKVVDDFPTLFQRVLSALNVKPALSIFRTDFPDLPLKSIDELCTHWNWSKVKVHLVASIAGRHEGWPSVILTGHTRLMKVIRKMDQRIGTGTRSKNLILECQGSSIGTYTTRWINEFFHSAKGESAEDWLDQPRKRQEALPYPPVKILFPSLKTVKESVLGEEGGGTMFCSRKVWSGVRFPRHLFYDSNSKAGRVLMHSKMILGLVSTGACGGKEPESGSETEDSDQEIQIVEKKAIGWAYVGSHNFTPSAWGTLSGSGFNPILNIRNYELGIVFPLNDADHVERVACWKRPPRKYILGEDLPWIQEESKYHQN